MFKTIISSTRYQLEVGKQSNRRLAENTHNSQSSDRTIFVTSTYYYGGDGGLKTSAFICSSTLYTNCGRYIRSNLSFTDLEAWIEKKSLEIVSAHYIIIFEAFFEHERHLWMFQGFFLRFSQKLPRHISKNLRFLRLLLAPTLDVPVLFYYWCSQMSNRSCLSTVSVVNIAFFIKVSYLRRVLLHSNP